MTDDAADPNGWRPIASAPRDGTIILAYFPKAWMPSHKPDGSGDIWAIQTVRWAYDPTLDLSDWLEMDGGPTMLEPPTHWQPLPARPLAQPQPIPDDGGNHGLDGANPGAVHWPVKDDVERGQ